MTIENDYMTPAQREVYERYATYTHAEMAGEGDLYLGAIGNLNMAAYDRLAKHDKWRA